MRRTDCLGGCARETGLSSWYIIYRDDKMSSFMRSSQGVVSSGPDDFISQAMDSHKLMLAAVC